MKKFIAENYIASLNTIKQSLQLQGDIPFSKERILKCLENCGLPSNATFWTAFRNSGVIQQTSRGMYKFYNREPIHVDTLKKIYRSYQNLINKYCNKKNKTAPLEETVSVEELSIETDEQRAIKLLKNLGYVIFAPIGVLYSKV
jgi:hypothetical protein